MATKVKFKGKTFDDYTITDKGVIKNSKGEALKPWDNGHGYDVVDLMKDGKAVRGKVHIISAETFHGPRPKGKIVGHGDLNKKNNSKKNLSYITQQENVAHAQGESYLTPAQVTAIRGKLKTMSMREIAKEYNVEYHVIRDLKNKKTYN